MNALNELKFELQAIHDLRMAAAVLEWDQSTYMPPAAASSRGRQIALLSRLAHERLVAPKMSELFAGLTSLGDADSIDGALYRRARRVWETSSRVPAELVSEIQEHTAKTYVAWTEAKPNSDFAAVRPYLEKNLELSRQWADCFPGIDHVLDPFIDKLDPGMTTKSIRALFTELRGALVPILDAIVAKPRHGRACLEQAFDPKAQLKFGEGVIRQLGYDFQRGRQDLTHHPFMIRFAANDIRITTRVNPNDLESALLGTVHEAGHAMYEQHIDTGFDGTPLGEGTSIGVHESQSRLWENLVARSKPFWVCFYPELQKAFPKQFGDVTLDELYRAINDVSRSLIRVESDEVTYNLHVMLRFELEAQLLEGKLAVADLPDAWNARMESDLGVRPPDDAHGCMQDVHWYCMSIGGAFQGYALGNLMAAQFFEAAREALPNLDDHIIRGEFTPLRTWLAENVHAHGARYLPDELLARATGKPLSIDPFVRHLKRKYGELYDIAFD